VKIIHCSKIIRHCTFKFMMINIKTNGSIYSRISFSTSVETRGRDSCSIAETRSSLDVTCCSRSHCRNMWKSPTCNKSPRVAKTSLLIPLGASMICTGAICGKNCKLVHGHDTTGLGHDITDLYNLNVC
jgi:hypothetical protein